MASDIQDAGYNGKLRSLANVEGKEGYGLNVHSERVQVGAAIKIPNNPRRKWLLVVNEDDTLKVRVSLTETATDYITLMPHGFILFNELMPWTGLVFIVTSVDCPVIWTEATLAGV